ncbi:hypothetical protein DID88_001939 [Monilinia fructigena]|uniref:Uncharacterized protein n=1 Tax=Monilinia fructigena TaxID=38457 RepID=A0A395IYI1_9HELO|nr:hypothetical protein DID88_001939 [Monilinia fructigena]
MAYTFASPCRSICHGLTDLHFNDEQSNTTTDQGSDHHLANRQSYILGATRVEFAEAHVFAEANSIDSGRWHAVRTSQIEPRQPTHPRFGDWPHINVSPTSTLQINITDTKPSKIEDTQPGVVLGNEWPVSNGSQANNSQATIGRPDKPSPRHLKMSNNLPLRPKKIVKSSMNIGVDMPQLKATFREYKKEYTSAATIKQVNCIGYRILHLGTGNQDEDNSEMADIESEWGSLWERRRWLKREMLRIKSLYTSARCRRQERIQYDLRAGYDVAFIKSLK